jgi:hypothetical protein
LFPGKICRQQTLASAAPKPRRPAYGTSRKMNHLNKACGQKMRTAKLDF